MFLHLPYTYIFKVFIHASFFLRRVYLDNNEYDSQHFYRITIPILTFSQMVFFRNVR